MAILGTFAYEEDFLAAAKNLTASGFDNISLLSPVPLEEAQEVLGLGKSPVRRFSLAGAIIGAISGFAMAAGTSLVFILPTGGRAIITIPPFLIITYEMTILFGVLFTLLGFHFVSGLPAWRDKPYLASAGIDKFVVVVEDVAADQVARADAIIRDAGAEEIQHVEDER
jgi:molybdopterin-containing oxidoreductase family membrane subunit